MIARALVITIASFLFVACPGPPVPPTPDDFDDAGPNVSCATFCEHARELHCRQGQPTAKGASCETVCENVAKSGLGTVDLRCGYRARTCAAIDACDK